MPYRAMSFCGVASTANQYSKLALRYFHCSLSYHHFFLKYKFLLHFRRLAYLNMFTYIYLIIFQGNVLCVSLRYKAYIMWTIEGVYCDKILTLTVQCFTHCTVSAHSSQQHVHKCIDSAKGSTQGGKRSERGQSPARNFNNVNTRRYECSYETMETAKHSCRLVCKFP